MPTTFPYNYFKTEKIFTLKTLEISPAISVITTRDPKSIFSIYRDLIIKNIAENKLDDTTVDNNNEKIEELSILFQNINGSSNKVYFSNIYNFCKSMYDTKYLFLKEKKNYSKFSSLLRQLNINKNLFTKNLRYENPITFNLNSNISLNRILNDYDNEEKNAIDNIILGNNINFSLPSIGPILSIYTPDPYKIDISTLIYTLITTDNVPFPPNYLEYVPLFKQNITDTLSNILLQSDKENNLWNVKIGNSTNNNTLKYIKRYFKSVSISLTDIFFDTAGIKKKYFVPYKIEKNIISETSSIPSPAASSASSEPASKDDKIKAVIDANNTIVNHVIQEMSDNSNNLNKQNMKNILCSYLFFVINVFYDFYKKYIDKLNDVIVSLSVSKYKNQLNIASGFKYIEKLNISLLNFKKILLNNFYELFLPSSIINNNYGMILNKDGFYVSASSFIASNDDISNNFPFKQSISHSNIVNNKISLINFMFLNKSNTDIYDDKLLELGGFSYNNIITRNAISILNDFFDIDKRKNNLNIFLLELLERFFKENSCNVLITNLEAIINEPTNVKKEKDIEEYYKKCLFSSATYFIEVMKIDKKNSSKITNEEYKKRSIYLLVSTILSYNAEVCKYLLRDSTFLSTNILRRKVTDKFKTYSSTVFDKITSMKQKYKENKIIKSNVNKPVNAFTTVQFWESLKIKIQNKKLLIPILNKSNIIFIDIIDYTLRGKYGNDLILNFSNKNITENSNYIILFGKSLTEIKNNKLRVIKSEFMDKIKLINDSQIIRKNLFTLLNNSLIYNQYSSEITSSFKLFDLFKTFIKNKPSNFNKLIVSHIQIKNILDSI